jgi:ABC-type amino acid transport substrate-binding protein
MEKKRRRLKVLSPASKGHLLTRDGDLKIRTARHKADASPLEAKCSCPSRAGCTLPDGSVSGGLSRACLHRPARCGEMLGPMLASTHNLHSCLDLMREASAALDAGPLTCWVRQFEPGRACGVRGSKAPHLPPAGSMPMKHLLTLMSLLLALGIAGTAGAAREIRFAPEKDYGPFVSETAAGGVEGLSIDVLDAIKGGLDAPVLTLPAQPLAAILEAARRGEVDLISSLRPTPERSTYLAFTSPYVQVPAVLVVRQSLSPPRLSNLDGQKVAVGKGYAVEAFVRQHYPLVDWQAVPDDLTGLRGLMAGQYEAVVADIASVSHLLRQHQVKGVQVAQTIGFEYPLSFAYRKSLPQLGRQLEAGLQRLDPATRRTITDRWIDPETLRFEDARRTRLRWAGLVLALLAAVSLVGAYLYQRSKPAR